MCNSHLACLDWKIKPLFVLRGIQSLSHIFDCHIMVSCCWNTHFTLPVLSRQTAACIGPHCLQCPPTWASVQPSEKWGEWYTQLSHFWSTTHHIKNVDHIYILFKNLSLFPNREHGGFFMGLSGTPCCDDLWVPLGSTRRHLPPTLSLSLDIC